MMQPKPDTLTIEALNSAYIRLVTSFFQGSISSRTSQLTRFLSNPSPSEAFSIINQICPQKSNQPKSPLPVSQNAFKLKKAETKIFQEQSTHNFAQKKIQQNGMIKVSNKKSGQTKNEHSFDSKKKVQFVEQNVKQESGYKIQKLRTTTNRLAEIFFNNQKKVQKYELNSQQNSSSGKDSGQDKTKTS